MPATATAPARVSKHETMEAMAVDAFYLCWSCYLRCLLTPATGGNFRDRMHYRIDFERALQEAVDDKTQLEAIVTRKKHGHAETRRRARARIGRLLLERNLLPFRYFQRANAGESRPDPEPAQAAVPPSKWALLTYSR